MIHRIIIDIPNLKSPFKLDKIPHGIITVPVPNIGSASTNPIAIAMIKGKPTFNPIKWKIYNPIKQIINEIKIKVNWAFR